MRSGRCIGFFFCLMIFGFFSSQSHAGFPLDFRWCVATAAHQIEGNNIHSDWWAWEQLPGKIKHGDRSGMACDHWNRIEEDTSLLKELGVDAYRFSVEWAKIEPIQGQLDRGAIDHYRREIRLLKQNGIEPWITLHHFTLPKWFQDQGGWEHSDAPALFESYVRTVYREIANDVQFFVTVNEPLVHLGGAYLTGQTPPGKTGLRSIVAPMKGLLKSHARAYLALHELAKEQSKKISVGIAHHLRVFDPKQRWNPLHRLMTKNLDRLVNFSFMDALTSGRLILKVPGMLWVNEEIPDLAALVEMNGGQDFFGMNYYTRDRVRFSLSGEMASTVSLTPGAEVSDLNWEIYPRGLSRLVNRVRARFPTLPIYITENGLADHADAKRIRYLENHLKELDQLIARGAPIRGYCHWSLMDNFEWVEGFEPRFGLYEMDYKTMTRTARPSAGWYRDFIRSQ